jgi:HSP20 family protein
VADIVRHDPFRLLDREFGGLRGALDRLWNEPFPRAGLLEEGALDVDVYQRKGSVVVEASLPGFAREEIDVQFHEGVLSIKAEHSEEHEEHDKNYYRRERHYGAVSRRLALPGIVTDAPVDATLKGGVLTIKIAAPATPVPKPIEIKAG